MKTRPILFNGAMVRAILDGSKTQTRRVFNDKANWHFMEGTGDMSICPFGQVGDQLYVRETWMPDAPRDGTWADTSFYGCKAAPLSLIPGVYKNPKYCLFRSTWEGGKLARWRPSIHMPKWASRIQLEITGVRVERLKDISEENAESEGAKQGACGSPQEGSYKAGYASLWESINGAGSWNANPWVWVIEFKKVIL